MNFRFDKKMRYSKIKFMVLLVVISIAGCQKKNTEINDAAILHSNEEVLTKVIIYDVM